MKTYIYEIKYIKIKDTLKQTLKWYTSKWNTGKHTKRQMRDYNLRQSSINTFDRLLHWKHQVQEFLNPGWYISEPKVHLATLNNLLHHSHLVQLGN